MGYYDYEDLRATATAPNATQADIDALGAWFQAHGQRYWNGAYYDADDGIRVFPVYQKVGPDDYEITGYEIR